MSMEMIVWPVLGLLLAVLIALILRKKSADPEYDERQQLLRGKAYQHAFIVSMFYGVLYGVLTVSTGLHFMEDGAAVFIGAFLGLMVFAVECVWKDAFFTVRRTPRTYILLYAVITLSQIIGTVSEIRAGTLIENGLLTGRCLYPAMALTFLAILVTILIRRITEKEEA